MSGNLPTVKIGICGQAPSDYPEFAQFLVEQGIDSISLNPDSVLTATLAILETEQKTQEANRK
jgi:pyruvate, water dikinase